MSSKKKKKNTDTREFTALKQSSGKNSAQNCDKNCDKNTSQQMRFTDRNPAPGVEI